MTNLKSYTVLILLLTWIQSFGQVSKVNTDTSRCYGVRELQEIAARLNDADECEERLVIAEEKIKVKEETILLKNKEIQLKDEEIHLGNAIIVKKDDQIQLLTKDLNKEKKRHKFTKLGWATTSIVLSAVIFVNLFR